MSNELEISFRVISFKGEGTDHRQDGGFVLVDTSGSEPHIVKAVSTLDELVGAGSAGGAPGPTPAPTRFGDIGVRVDWGPVPDTGQKWPYPKRRWQGHYDDAWLRQHDLTKISH